MADQSISLGAAFAAVAERQPHHLAVKTRTAALTYGALNSTANRIAHAIVARVNGVQPVALYVHDRVRSVSAVLGICKAGQIYMPLDPDHPASRIEFMLNDAGAELVITDRQNLADAEALGKPVLNMDELDSALPESDPSVVVHADTPAWILYTSGSTGQPKGVAQTHGNVRDFARRYQQDLGITPDDRYVLVFSPVVNAGVHVIFSTLLNGASLYPIDLKREGIEALPAWLADNRITLYYSVPTVFRHLVDVLDGSRRLDAMRALILGGEPVYRRDVNRFRERFGAPCVLINRYGSSETGTVCWWFVNPEAPWPGHNVPVGFPVGDHEIVLADAAGRPAAQGAVGEIVVHGAHLSPGYWQRSDLTAAVFSEQAEGAKKRRYRTGDMGRFLPDGRLVCLGRKDAQIKVRGYRVEPGEIEQALIDLPEVREAFVTAHGNDGGTRVVAYLTAAAGASAPAAADLRQRLADTLPQYMLPDHYMWLAVLPRAPNGKVDRRALPPPARDAGSAGGAPPRNAFEEQIAAIWSEVLEVDNPGVHDSFFELGGNSLSATRVFSRIERDLGATLTVADMFNNSTIAELARTVAARLVRVAADSGRNPPPETEY